MGHVSVAVGCAVGIPVGLSFLVAFAFWMRMQRRYKKEDARDRELENVIRDGSSDNVETWQETPREKKDFDANEEYVDSSKNEASSSSEQLQQPNEIHHDKHQSTRYVPAYRRNLSAYRIRQLPTGVRDGKNGSNMSLDSTQNMRKQSNLYQGTVYDQMIPVLANTNEEDTDATINQNQQNNEKVIMKNIRNNDFGSYPKRNHSVTTLSLSHTNSHTNTNTNTNPNASRSSLFTRSSSGMSAVKGVSSYENISDTPKSTTMTSLVDPKDNNNNNNNNNQQQQQQVYSLKNNYDIKNTSEIKEEDQYENEFTNYSESKRAFIDNLRPKPGV